MVDVLPGLAGSPGCPTKLMPQLTGAFSPNFIGMPLLIAGLALALVGASHRFAPVALLDTKAFIWLYHWLAPLRRSFAYIWPLGTTPVAIVLMSLFFIPSLRLALSTALVYVGIALLERLLKTSIQRPRPFRMIEVITCHQPKPPRDASFPSGDAMRVWYIGLLLPAIFGLPVWVYLVTMGIALIMSLGRVALGVHYPLDITAGSGLGLAGASLALLLGAS